MDAQRAYHWPKENFTRLTVGLQRTELIISHNPMKISYGDATDYQNIVLPILQEEWKYSSLSIRKEHTCSGELRYAEYLETLTEKGKEFDVYAIEIVIMKTKFWAVENFVAIGSVTLEGVKISKKV